MNSDKHQYIGLLSGIAIGILMIIFLKRMYPAPIESPCVENMMAPHVTVHVDRMRSSVTYFCEIIIK